MDIGERLQMTGVVKWFSDHKGFGFITIGNTNVFVHYTAIDGTGHRSLTEGEQVLVKIKHGTRGTFATRVVRLPGRAQIPWPKPRQW